MRTLASRGSALVAITCNTDVFLQCSGQKNEHEKAKRELLFGTVDDGVL